MLVVPSDASVESSRKVLVEIFPKYVTVFVVCCPPCWRQHRLGNSDLEVCYLKIILLDYICIHRVHGTHSFILLTNSLNYFFAIVSVYGWVMQRRLGERGELYSDGGGS